MEKHNEADFLKVLKMVSPGTALRAAIDDVQRSGRGGLIVINSDPLQTIIEGGFRLKTKFTHQKLVELSKMDGAVIVSENLKKILFANVMLIPDHQIKTKETGTRHKSAERTAKQAKTLAIAISERLKKVTLYYKNIKFELNNPEEILRRSTETLRILEKQRELYNEIITNLNVLEVTNLVTVSDVCSTIQRIEIILNIEDIIKKSLIELGREGLIIKMRLTELMKNIEQEKYLIIEDYFNEKSEKIVMLLNQIEFDDILDNKTLSEKLFQLTDEKHIHPQGKRILTKAGLHSTQIKSLIENFGSLSDIFNSDQESLNSIFSSDFAKEISFKLKSIKEKIMLGKNI